jgi:hypothetical protein
MVGFYFPVLLYGLNCLQAFTSSIVVGASTSEDTATHSRGAQTTVKLVPRGNYRASLNIS